MTVPEQCDNPVAAPRRSFATRRSLPNGRAVVGALLVTLSAVGTFVVAVQPDAGPDDSYLVLTNDIAAGATLSADDVAAVPMELAPEVAATVRRSTAGLDGATALTGLRAGSLGDKCLRLYQVCDSVCRLLDRIVYGSE